MFRNHYVARVAAWVLVPWLVPLISVSTAVASPFESSRSLNADALAEAVLARNPGVKALQSAADAARFRIAPAGTLDDPMLSYGVPPNTFGERVGKVEISQALPWPGKLALRTDAARERANVAREEVSAMNLRLAATAKMLFAEWAFVRSALSINARHQSLLSELRQVAETHYAAGSGNQQDALQVEVARVGLERDAITLERRQREVQARINALLDRPPEAALPAPAALPSPTALPSLRRLQEAATEQHPELRQVRAHIRASSDQLKLAEKAFYPDFRVSTGYNSLWDNVDKRWTVGVSINLPLDYGSKRSAAVDAARADARRAQWQLTDRASQLRSEIDASRAAVVAQANIIHLYDGQLLPLANDNLDAAVANYRGGGGAFINVLDAERQKLRTEEGLARAKADYLRARAVLERWAGGPLSRLAVQSSQQEKNP